MNAIPCPKLECRGNLDDEGFCERCGNWDPLVTQAQSASESASTSSSSWSSRLTSGGALTVASTGMTSGELVQLPPLPEDEPDSLVLLPDRQMVPERHRECGECRHPVGRSRPERPGLTQGFCPKCHTRFSFMPTLQAGDVVGRYEIVGPLAHGGVGWVYLAKDTSLGDRRVVLKGLINTGNERALKASVAERRYLTLLEHPNIVRILDFVTQPDPRTEELAGYIVMEFVGGWTLERIKKEAVEGRHPLPMENIVLYGLQLLRALGYLHERGYLYCDLKPDNVIHGGQVRLIDLGAVRAITDKTSPTWGAPSFRVSDNEIRERGLTVRSDLYSVGTTLRALFRNSTDDRADRSSAERIPIAEGLASFRAVLERATSTWEHRFESAADMAEQLMGVLRQITALRGEELRADPSRVFAQPTELFDAGLGVPPALSRWTRTKGDNAAPLTGAPMDDGRPDPAWVAVRLPNPLIDPEDPAAPVLVTVSATDLDRLLEELQRLPRTIETALWRSRVHMALYMQEGGDGLTRAQEDLAEAGAIAAGRTNWRLHWHSGLLALVEAVGIGDLTLARSHFELVHRMLPGETTPMLALAFCAEAGADRTRAEQLYHAVLVTDRSWASAAFGLARIRLAAGDRDRAVAVLDEISPLSRYFDAARTAAVQIRIGTFTGTGPPELSDLRDAAHRLMLLSLDEAPRIRLATLIQQAALEYEHLSTEPVVAPGRPATGVSAVLGDLMTRKDLQRRLEASFRHLARQAPDRNQRVALADLANAVRPWSLI